LKELTEKQKETLRLLFGDNFPGPAKLEKSAPAKAAEPEEKQPRKAPPPTGETPKGETPSEKKIDVGDRSDTLEQKIAMAERLPKMFAEQLGNVNAKYKLLPIGNTLRIERPHGAEPLEFRFWVSEDDLKIRARDISTPGRAPTSISDVSTPEGFMEFLKTRPYQIDLQKIQGQPTQHVKEIDVHSSATVSQQERPHALFNTASDFRKMAENNQKAFSIYQEDTVKQTPDEVATKLKMFNFKRADAASGFGV